MTIPMPNLNAAPAPLRAFQRHGFVLDVMLGILIVGALLFVPQPTASQTRNDPSEPAPGLVTIEEGSLFMSCEGEPGPLPTVVFDNGRGDDFTSWRGIQPEIAKITRACAYDRLGVGRSDAVSDEDTRTPFEMATTLRALLAEAGIDGPLVMVGHSLAGLILLAYPHLYPDEVAGLVFVDASHPQQWVRFREVNPESGDPLATVGSERFDRGAATEELATVGDFGDVPVAVLYQARPSESPLRPIWVELQEDHASRSSRSRLIPAHESGHYVHNDEPHLVIEAIRWVLDGAARR